MLSKLIRDEKGQDMVEYALLASFISIVAIAPDRPAGRWYLSGHRRRVGLTDA
jgi:hypothetical protein